MHFRSLIIGGGSWGQHFGWANRRWHSNKSNLQQSSASSGSAATGRGSYFDRVKGFQGPWKAALTSASLSATGDLLAQFGGAEFNRRNGLSTAPYDPSRTLRMFGFGLFLYGPIQFYWYNLLEWLMPIKTTLTFLTKVTANQLMLAPVTLTTVFSWNLALTGQGDKIGDKIKNDLWPTMKNGWKFWVPAASVNFYAIPVEYQVLYMSCCGVLWTAYLSYASVNQISSSDAAPALPSDSKSKKKQ